MTRQLLLDLGAPPPPTLDNFVIGRNGELLQALNLLTDTDQRAQLPFASRCLYLWGAPGSGRSHLLRALSALPCSRYACCGGPDVLNLEWDQEQDAWPLGDSGADIAVTRPIRTWLVDNIDLARPEEQVALFNLINAVRAQPRSAIVMVGNVPPLHLALGQHREDLRTRLGWGLVFQVQPLQDREKEAALARHAAERGLPLSPDVLRYLMNHFSRDMPSLMQLMSRLDDYSLEQKRAITLPLIRAWMQQHPPAAI